jgi:hypothetical protein
MCFAIWEMQKQIGSTMSEILAAVKGLGLPGRSKNGTRVWSVEEMYQIEAYILRAAQAGK